MKVKRMGIREILRRIWLFSANKIKSSESISKQATQLIIAADDGLLYAIAQMRAVPHCLDLDLNGLLTRRNF